MTLTTFDRSPLPAPRPLEDVTDRLAAAARALAGGLVALLRVLAGTARLLAVTSAAVGRWFLAEPRRIRTALAGVALSAAVGAGLGAVTGYLVATATEQAIGALHLDRA